MFHDEDEHGESHVVRFQPHDSDDEHEQESSPHFQVPESVAASTATSRRPSIGESDIPISLAPDFIPLNVPLSRRSSQDIQQAEFTHHVMELAQKDDSIKQKLEKVPVIIPTRRISDDVKTPCDAEKEHIASQEFDFLASALTSRTTHRRLDSRTNGDDDSIEFGVETAGKLGSGRNMFNQIDEVPTKTGSSRWSESHRHEFADRAKHRMVAPHDLDALDRDAQLQKACDRGIINNQKLEDIFPADYHPQADHDPGAKPSYNDPASITLYEEMVQAIMLDTSLVEGEVDEDEIRHHLLKLEASFHQSHEIAQDLSAKHRLGKEGNLTKYHDLLTLHINNIHQHYYYRAASFAKPEDYDAWFAAEKDALTKQLTETTKLLADSKKSTSARKTTSPRDGKQQVKKSFWFCCGTAVPEEQTTEAKLPEVKPQQSYLDLKLEDDVVNIDHHAHFASLLQILSQDDSSGSNRHVAINTVKGIQTMPLKPLSADSNDLLDIYCDVYRVGDVYKHLQYLDLYSKNLTNTNIFFATVYNTVMKIVKFRDRDDVQWTKLESDLFLQLISDLYSWCNKCISRYQLVFYKNKDGLKECIALYQKLHGLLIKLNPKAGLATFKDCLKKSVEDAVGNQYQTLIKATMTFLSSSAQVAPGMGIGESQGEASRLGNIIDSQQLLHIFKTVSEEIRDDLDYDSVFSAECKEFSLVSVTSDVYMSYVWADTKIFLRKLSLSQATSPVNKRKGSKPSPIKFDSTVFKIYSAMKDMYALLDRIRELPPLQVQEWFEPFIIQWLNKTQQDFDREFMESLVNTDKFSEISSDHRYSDSVMELFSLLYPLTDQFKLMPYTTKHCQIFAGLMTNVVCNYIRKLIEYLNPILDREDKKGMLWGFDKLDKPDANGEMLKLSLDKPLLIRMNNIWICRAQLFDLLDTIDLKRAYENTPQLSTNAPNPLADEAPKRRYWHREKKIEDMDDDTHPEVGDEDDGLPPEVIEELGCEQSFKYIRTVIDQLSIRISQGLGQFTSRELTTLLWKPKIDSQWTLEQTRTELEALWQFLNKQLDHLYLNLYDFYFHRIGYFVVADMLVVIENEMVHPKKGDYKKYLRKEQIKRASYAKQLLIEYFRREYELSDTYSNQLKTTNVERLNALEKILTGPSSELVKLHESMITDKELETLKKSNFAQQETWRVSHPPYLHKQQVYGILKFRKEFEDDTSTKEFFKKNKEHFYSNWFS